MFSLMPDKTVQTKAYCKFMPGGKQARHITRQWPSGHGIAVLAGVWLRAEQFDVSTLLSLLCTARPLYVHTVKSGIWSAYCATWLSVSVWVVFEISSCMCAYVYLENWEAYRWWFYTFLCQYVLCVFTWLVWFVGASKDLSRYVRIVTDHG